MHHWPKQSQSHSHSAPGLGMAMLHCRREHGLVGTNTFTFRKCNLYSQQAKKGCGVFTGGRSGCGWVGGGLCPISFPLSCYLTWLNDWRWSSHKRVWIPHCHGVPPKSSMACFMRKRNKVSSYFNLYSLHFCCIWTIIFILNVNIISEERW